MDIATAKHGGLRHHLNVTVALIENTVELVGDISRGQGKTLPGRRKQTVFDISEGEGADCPRHGDDQQHDHRQPAIQSTCGYRAHALAPI